MKGRLQIYDLCVDAQIGPL